MFVIRRNTNYIQRRIGLFREKKQHTSIAHDK